MRTMPEAGKKNPVAALVYWFYQYKWGIKPDASIYARHGNKKNMKSVGKLMVRDEEYDTEIYTPSDVAMAIYYLEDEGVEVKDLSIVTIPGLMFAYTNRNSSKHAAEELERIMNYLKGKSNGNSTESFKPPPGW